MHMADALLSPAVAGTMYVASGVATGISLKKLNLEEDHSKLPVMAVSAALVFAGQMINYTIPGTGSSGHLCGGMLLSALLGPFAGFISMVVILTIQCLLFADGGLMALGANCWNMGFYGCFIGYFLLWMPIMGMKISGNIEDSKKNGIIKRRIWTASILGCVISLQLGAFSVVCETLFSGITELPFATFMILMQPIHLAIGLVEGVITAAVLSFVYEARPELLKGVNKDSKKSRFSLKTTVVILAVLTVLVGGLLSNFASSYPDGLEWSLFGNEEGGFAANMSLDEENYGVTSSVAESAGAIQEKTALLPDYELIGVDEALATSIPGVVGSLVVALGAGVVYMLVKAGSKKKQN